MDSELYVLDDACKELLIDLAIVCAIDRGGGGIKTASRLLKLPATTVSTRVDRLQKALGEDTILESGRRHDRHFNRIGKRYLQMAEEILPILDVFLNDLDRLRNRRCVHLATIHSAWFQYGENMKAYCKDFEVEAHFGKTPQAVVDMVADRSCDVGIVSYMERIAAPLSLYVWKEEPMILAASVKQFVGVGPNGLTKQDLTTTPLIAFHSGLVIADEIDRYLSETLRLNIRNRKAIGKEIETLITAVEKDMGISILPEPCVKDNPKIKIFRLPKPMKPRPLAVICHRDALKQPLVRKFLSFFDGAREHFDKENRTRKEGRLKASRRNHKGAPSTKGE